MPQGFAQKLGHVASTLSWRARLKAPSAANARSLGVLAQSVERLLCKQVVGSSSLPDSIGNSDGCSLRVTEYPYAHSGGNVIRQGWCLLHRRESAGVEPMTNRVLCSGRNTGQLCILVVG